MALLLLLAVAVLPAVAAAQTVGLVVFVHAPDGATPVDEANVTATVYDDTYGPVTAQLLDNPPGTGMYDLSADLSSATDQWTVSAVYGTYSAVQSVYVDPQSPPVVQLILQPAANNPSTYTTVVTANPPAVPADGVTPAVVTAAVYDLNGKPVPGIPVDFSTTLPGAQSVTGVVYNTSNQGVAVWPITSTVPGAIAVSANVAGAPPAGTAVTFLPVGGGSPGAPQGSPQCSPSVQTDCWNGLLVNGQPNADAQLVPLVRQTGPNLSVQLLNGRSADGYDLTTKTGYDTSTVFTVSVPVPAGLHPTVLAATGNLSSWSVQNGVLTVTGTAARSSWSKSGCTQQSCPAKADVDYGALFLVDVADLSTQTNGLSGAALTAFQTFVQNAAGTWVNTNAQSFSIPQYNPQDGGFDFAVGAPHYQGDGATVNSGSFTAFLPWSLLTHVWNIPQGQNVSVSGTVGGSPAQLTVTQDATGVTIRYSGFHYSTEAVSLIPTWTPPGGTGGSPGGSTGGSTGGDTGGNPTGDGTSGGSGSNSTTAPASTGIGGTAVGTAAPTAQALQQALTAGNGTAVVSVQTVNGQANVQFSANALAALSQSTGTLQIQSGQATVRVPTADLAPTALAQNPSLAGLNLQNAQLTLNIQAAPAPATLAAPTGPAGAITPVSQVYTFDLQVQAGGTTAHLENFLQPIVVQMPYTPTPGTDPELLTAFRLSPDGGAPALVGGIANSATNTLTVGLTHFSQYVVLEYHPAFTDMTGHWGAHAVAVAAAHGITNGVTTSSFAPDATVTRATFVTMLVRALGLQSPGTATSFQDVSGSAWYAGAVAAAAQAGLVTGTSQATFSPDAPVTRAEMAVLVQRAAAYQGKNTTLTAPALQTALAPFADARSAPPWAVASMAYAVQAGLLNGESATTLNPTGSATRTEAATVLVRYLFGAAGN